MKIHLIIPSKLLAVLRFTTLVAAATILLEAGIALAQTPVQPAQSDGEFLTQSAQTIIHTAQDPTSPKYLIVIVCIFVLCQLFKRWGHKVPALGPWLIAHPWGDWIVGVVLAVSGATVTSVTGGKGIDVGLILSALVTGMAASGTPLAIFGTGPTQGAPPSDGKAEAAGAAASNSPSKTLNS